MKKLLAILLALYCAPAIAQTAITLPIAANAVADLGNGPIKVRMTAGNASIFTSQGSGVGSTSGSSTTLTLTATPTTPPIVGGLISGAGITSGTTIIAYNGTTGITLSAAMTVAGGTTVSWGAACPSTPPSNVIQASAQAGYYVMYTQARVCAVSPGGPVNTLLIEPIFYDQALPNENVPGGINGQVQVNNSGSFGGLTNAQLTALINSATASLSGALPAWPGNTTTYFRGDGTYATLNFAALASTPTTLAGYGITSPLPVAQGGTGAGTVPGAQAALSMGAVSAFLSQVSLTSATTDHALVVTLPTGYTRFRVLQITLSNATGDIHTGTIGVFTATGGSGTVAADQAITITTASANTNANGQTLTITNQSTQFLSPASFGVANTLQVRVGTAVSGQAVDVTIFMQPLP
jgi:hypothetical protein